MNLNLNNTKTMSVDLSFDLNTYSIDEIIQFVKYLQENKSDKIPIRIVDSANKDLLIAYISQKILEHINKMPIDQDVKLHLYKKILIKSTKYENETIRTLLLSKIDQYLKVNEKINIKNINFVDARIEFKLKKINHIITHNTQELNSIISLNNNCDSDANVNYSQYILSDKNSKNCEILINN